MPDATRDAKKDAPEYEFEVVEDFTASHLYYVRAGTRQEALGKVLSDDYDYVVRGDLRPKRSMNVRDVRRLRFRQRGGSEPGTDGGS